MDLSDGEMEKIAGEKLDKRNKFKTPKGAKDDEKSGFEEEVMGKISMGGLLNPSNLSADEIEKWVNARRKNFPTRENIEARKARIE